MYVSLQSSHITTGLFISCLKLPSTSEALFINNNFITVIKSYLYLYEMVCAEDFTLLFGYLH